MFWIPWSAVSNYNKNKFCLRFIISKSGFQRDCDFPRRVSPGLFVCDAGKVTPAASFMSDYFSQQVKQRSAAISNFCQTMETHQAASSDRKPVLLPEQELHVNQPSRRDAAPSAVGGDTECGCVSLETRWKLIHLLSVSTSSFTAIPVGLIGFKVQTEKTDAARRCQISSCRDVRQWCLGRGMKAQADGAVLFIQQTTKPLRWLHRSNDNGGERRSTTRQRRWSLDANFPTERQRRAESRPPWVRRKSTAWTAAPVQNHVRLVSRQPRRFSYPHYLSPSSPLFQWIFLLRRRLGAELPALPEASDGRQSHADPEPHRPGGEPRPAAHGGGAQQRAGDAPAARWAQALHIQVSHERARWQVMESNSCGWTRTASNETPSAN